MAKAGRNLLPNIKSLFSGVLQGDRPWLIDWKATFFYPVRSKATDSWLPFIFHI